MMTVTTHPTDEVLRTVTEYFPLIKEDEWFEDQLVKDMILAVDQTKTTEYGGFWSPYFGSMPSSDLSGGVKGLIMIYKYPEEREYSSVIFGDNCVEWLCKLSFLTDFTLVLQHAIRFVDDTPIAAVTADGTPLTLAGEVMDYYLENRPRYMPREEEVPDTDTE